MPSRVKQLWFTVSQVVRLMWQSNRRLLIFLIVVSTLPSLTIIPNLYLDRAVLDTLINNVGKPDLTPVLWFISELIAIRLLLAIVTSFLNRLSTSTTRLMSWRFRMHLEQALSKQFSRIEISTLEDPEFKDRYQRVEREGMDRAFTLVSSFSGLPNYFTAMVSALAIFIFQFPIIVLAIIVLIIPSILVDSKMIKLEYGTEKKLSTAYRFRSMIIYYLIRARSYLELRILGISDYLTKKLSRYQLEIINAKKYREKQRVIFRTLGNLPYQVFSFALNGYFAYLALTRLITVGTSQIYIRAIATFSDNFGGLISSILEFYENYLYVSDLTWFLNLQPSRAADLGQVFPRVISQGITFDHVWFKYPGLDTWILKDVSFSVSSKENIALVGENGAGKTTLVKLLAGFYEPTRGQILIDGLPVSDYSRSSYWHRLAVFFQEFESYDFNARESIAYGNLDKIDDLPEVKRYAQMTDIDSWIESLGQKYEHPLSRNYETGISPSTGQWQRLALTRTLIKDSAILILDEPTSNVDPQAEENIFNEVLEYGKDKILIFISHRFSTVRRADRIFVLEQGTIVEQGSHEQLLKQSGIYSHLFKLQAKNYQ